MTVPHALCSEEWTGDWDSSFKCIICVCHPYWLMIFHNDSYSQFKEKDSWYAANAYIITVVTVVNTPHIDHNVWTNTADFITCKMTKWRESILKIEFVCSLNKTLHCPECFLQCFSFCFTLWIAYCRERKTLSIKLEEMSLETALSDWQPSEQQMTRVILQNDTWMRPWHDDLRMKAFRVILLKVSKVNFCYYCEGSKYKIYMNKKIHLAFVICTMNTNMVPNTTAIYKNIPKLCARDPTDYLQCLSI